MVESQMDFAMNRRANSFNTTNFSEDTLDQTEKEFLNLPYSLSRNFFKLAFAYHSSICSVILWLVPAYQFYIHLTISELIWGNDF